MLEAFKACCGSAAHAMGYEINKSRDLRTNALLGSLGIDLLIDVGANQGQYALSRRAGGYKGEIVSFEPLSTAHAKLLALARKDPKWMIADRMAIGDHSGEIEINIAGNSASSSVLPMLDACLAAEPRSRYIGRETVPMRRLDDALQSTRQTRNIFLKLDVQGFEGCVLAGAERILAGALGLQLELALLPLYRGETVLPEMTRFLREKGFELWDLQPGFRDRVTGRLLQADGLFTKQHRC
jgi:FkbM family methyltransferase